MDEVLYFQQTHPLLVFLTHCLSGMEVAKVTRQIIPLTVCTLK